MLQSDEEKSRRMSASNVFNVGKAPEATRAKKKASSKASNVFNVGKAPEATPQEKAAMEATRAKNKASQQTASSVFAARCPKKAAAATTAATQLQDTLSRQDFQQTLLLMQSPELLDSMSQARVLA